MTRRPRRGHEPAAAAVPSGFFVMRTPLLPHDSLVALSDGLEAGRVTDPARLAEALAADRARLRQRLRDAIARPAIREAVFLASPSLDASLAIWERDPESRYGQKIERALWCYMARMAGRPTPAGLLAGWSTGAIADETELALEGVDAYRRHTQLDLDFLVALSAALSRRPELRQRLRYGANPGLYHAAGQLRWTVRNPTARTGAFRLVAAERTPYLDATLRRAAPGALLSELADALLGDDPEIARDDATGYVEALVDAELLTSPFAPRLTGGVPVDALVEQLAVHPELEGVARQLADAGRALAALDRAGLGAPPAQYRAIAAGLESPGVRADLSTLIRVELVKPARAATLGGEPVAEILRGVEILRRLARPAPGLRRFAEAFAMRYGDAEVPLLEALDEDTGIGFDPSLAPAAEAEPLLAGMSFASADAATPFDAVDAFLLRRVEEVVRRSGGDLALSHAELVQLGERQSPALPAAFAVVARLAARSREAVSRGEFAVLLDRVVGPSGAGLLGRGCHADAALLAGVTEHLRAEEALRPDAVFAEVVYLPEGGLGSLAVRPVLRGHEIPYLARSGAPEDRQLPMSDLRISINRATGEVAVRSARLDREVVPRMTTPHEARPGAPGVVRFLAAVQGQGAANRIAFSWGALSALAFLPRVTAGRVVLSRARWKLGPEPLSRLAASGLPRFRAVQQLRAALGIPRWVELVESGNHLLLDLDNALSVEVFGHRVRERPQATVVEHYPGADELCAEGPEGHFVSELVIPFVSDRTGAARRSQRTEAPRWTTPRTAPRGGIQERFLPGSEWLQINLYGGPRAADSVLRELVAPVVAAALSSGAIDRWFFVRYSDLDHHVRLHCHGQPASLMAEVLPALRVGAEALLQDGKLWTFRLDGYQRETERYGGPEGIELAEQIFQADSEAVLGLVESFAGGAAADARWRLALLGIDLLLDDLGLDLAAKLAWATQARRSFAQLLDAPPVLDHQLGTRYRAEHASLAALRHGDDGTLAPGLELLHQRSRNLAPLTRELDARLRAGRLSQPRDALALSYVHMFTNRVFRSAALAQELVLYDWLRRLYRGDLHRAERG